MYFYKFDQTYKQTAIKYYSSNIRRRRFKEGSLAENFQKHHQMKHMQTWRKLLRRKIFEKTNTLLNILTENNNLRYILKRQQSIILKRFHNNS